MCMQSTTQKKTHTHFFFVLLKTSRVQISRRNARKQNKKLLLSWWQHLMCVLPYIVYEWYANIRTTKIYRNKMWDKQQTWPKMARQGNEGWMKDKRRSVDRLFGNCMNKIYFGFLFCVNEHIRGTRERKRDLA